MSKSHFAVQSAARCSVFLLMIGCAVLPYNYGGDGTFTKRTLDAPHSRYHLNLGVMNTSQPRPMRFELGQLPPCRFGFRLVSRSGQSPVEGRAPKETAYVVMTLIDQTHEEVIERTEGHLSSWVWGESRTDEGIEHVAIGPTLHRARNQVDYALEVEIRKHDDLHLELTIEALGGRTAIF